MDTLPVLHKACDECRNRKLKCTAEQPICARCARDRVSCHYSIQKTMGRPRKRQKCHDVLPKVIGNAADLNIKRQPAASKVEGKEAILDLGKGSFGSCSKKADVWDCGTTTTATEDLLNAMPGFMKTPSSTTPATPFDISSFGGGGGSLDFDASDFFSSSLFSDFDSSIFASTGFTPCHEADLSFNNLPRLEQVHTPPSIRETSVQTEHSSSMPNNQDIQQQTPIQSDITSPFGSSTLRAPPFHALKQDACPLPQPLSLPRKDSNSFSDNAGLYCNCLISLFETILQLKRNIHNPVALSPQTGEPLHHTMLLSEKGLSVAKQSLDCDTCEMCFTTVVNLGQLLGLLIRSYSQCLMTVGILYTPACIKTMLLSDSCDNNIHNNHYHILPSNQDTTTLEPITYKSVTKKLVSQEVDKLLVLLGKMEIRSLKRHGKTVTVVMNKDIAGRGIAETTATGCWVGDRNPFCMKIIGMVRMLADGLVSEMEELREG